VSVLSRDKTELTTHSGRSLIVPSLHSSLNSRPFSTSCSNTTILIHSSHVLQYCSFRRYGDDRLANKTHTDCNVVHAIHATHQYCTHL